MPDFIVAGFLDDVSVVTFVLRTVFKSITRDKGAGLTSSRCAVEESSGANAPSGLEAGA